MLTGMHLYNWHLELKEYKKEREMAQKLCQSDENSLSYEFLKKGCAAAI